jgi:hypothetical protein
MPEARKAWILALTFEVVDRIELGLQAVAGKVVVGRVCPWIHADGEARLD